MLAFEWHELETLGTRLRTLCHRYAHAQRSEHFRVIDGLKLEVARLERQRDVLLRYITVRLSLPASGRHPTAATARALPAADRRRAG